MALRTVCIGTSFMSRFNRAFCEYVLLPNTLKIVTNRRKVESFIILKGFFEHTLNKAIRCKMLNFFISLNDLDGLKLNHIKPGTFLVLMLLNQGRKVGQDFPASF
jgi:hypothetical protein